MMFKIKKYFWGLSSVTEHAPWRYGGSPLFYTGELTDGRKFVAKYSSPGWGDSVSPAYIEVDGVKQTLRDSELECLLQQGERILSPWEERMSRTIAVKEKQEPFWTKVFGPALGESRWILVCPHGYESGHDCPVCEGFSKETSPHVALFCDEGPLKAYTVYSVPEAERLLDPTFEEYMNRVHPDWGGYREDMPYQVWMNRWAALSGKWQGEGGM